MENFYYLSVHNQYSSTNSFIVEHENPNTQALQAIITIT